MLPPAVVEQQAKLGVSAEESKAQRAKRQQARFRDRGGAFVPSTANPLLDILLARTVSGESPTKARSKNVSAKRLSPRKPRQASPTRKAATAIIAEESQAIAGSSKSKLPKSRKGKTKAVEPRAADTVSEPLPKGRGTKKGKRKTLDPGSDAEQPPPATTKSKPTPKGRGKQRAAPSTSDGNPKTKNKSKPKTKPVKEVIEVLLDSDDDQRLVEVPYKAKSNPKRNRRYECDGETDDDVPIVRKTVTRVKTERIAVTRSSEKKELEEREERTQDENCPKINVKKRPVNRDEDDDDDVAAPPAKKGKKLTSTKPTAAMEPEPTPHPIKEVKGGKGSKGTGKGNRKGRADPDQDIVEVEEDRNGETLPKAVLKPKKRKKEEDNCDDRPRKVVKFAETGAPHSSSQKLKENKPDKKRERASESNIKLEDPAALRPKLATKPPPAKTPKGPPREVLERIKASTARHLRCLDSEPDELDCLS